MAYLAYIIGEIPDRITVKCRHKFENAKFLLEKKGFKLSIVMNPHDYKYSVNGKLFKNLNDIKKYYF